MGVLLGSRYRIGSDGWWHVPGGVPILTTDAIQVVDLNESYVVVDVQRDGISLGLKSIHHSFFAVDFERASE